jgi:hypothetical protein
MVIKPYSWEAGATLEEHQPARLRVVKQIELALFLAVMRSR